MAAAAHGATFPMAKKLRSSMTLQQMAEFEDTPTKGLPKHVKPASRTRRVKEYQSSYRKGR